MHRLELVPILLIAISSNADNMVVGIAYGIRNIRVPLRSNLFIALFTGVLTLVSMLAGQGLRYSMPQQLASVLGGVIIAGIGVWILLQSARLPATASETPAARIRRPKALDRVFTVLNDPASADRDLSGEIDVKEVWLLAIALSLNNVTNGVGSGMAGLDPVLTTIAVTAFSVAMLSAGVTAGRYGQRMVGSFAKVISGVLLIAAGIYSIRM